MFSNPHHRHADASKSIFMSSVTGLANTTAVVATFPGAPILYAKTIDWMQDFTASNYGYGFEDIVSFAWFITCGALVFFISRASVSTALVMGGLAAATRFL